MAEPINPILICIFGLVSLWCEDKYVDLLIIRHVKWPILQADDDVK